MIDCCSYKACPHESGYFLNLQVFLSGFKNLPIHRQHIQMEFTCSQVSKGIRIQSSTQGSSPIKCLQSMCHRARDCGIKFAVLLLLCLPIGLCSVRDWTRFCHDIGFENIQIHTSTRYWICCALIFVTLQRADLRISGFAVEFTR